MKLIVTAILVNGIGIWLIAYAAGPLPVKRLAWLVAACALLSGAAFAAGCWFGRFGE